VLDAWEATAQAAELTERLAGLAAKIVEDAGADVLSVDRIEQFAERTTKGVSARGPVGSRSGDDGGGRPDPQKEAGRQA
jgi:hypothetical protein